MKVDMLADIKVDKVANIKVDMVADMEVVKGADMKVDLVTDKVSDRVAHMMEVFKVADMDFSIIFFGLHGESFGFL